MRTKITTLLLALVLCMSAFALPLTAYAAGASDTTPPTLTVKLDGGQLTISASDDNSGVEAVYIDGNRVNLLVGGKATVTLKDYAGTEKTVSIYAVDYAGNRSETKKLDNPYYKEPAQQTQQGTSGTGGTGQTSQSGNSGQTGGTGSTQNQSTNNTANTAQTQAADNAAASEPSTEETVSAIPDGAFTPEGTGTILDSATDADGDKQFYTITTEAGNVFYLIIDGKRDNNNVYFLNGVTEADLMALAEKDDSVTISSVPAIETCICTDKCEAGHVNTDCPVCKNDLTKCCGKETQQETEPIPAEPEQTAEKGGGNTGTIIFIIVAVIAVAGIGYCVKIVRPKQQSSFDDDDEGFEDENLAPDDYYAEPEYLSDDDEYNGDGE